MVRAKKKKVAAVAGREPFASTVHVSAAYMRPNQDRYMPTEGHNYAVRGLRTDDKGNLIGIAACGDTCFVCTKAEIKGVRDFLSEVLTAQAA
jgi:hypothetical protein